MRQTYACITFFPIHVRVLTLIKLYINATTGLIKNSFDPTVIQFIQTEMRAGFTLCRELLRTYTSKSVDQSLMALS